MYATDDLHGGNLGGRSGSSNLCKSSVSFNLAKKINGCSNTQALLSFSNTDSALEMPNNFSFSNSIPIFNSSGRKLYKNWNNIFTNDSTTTPWDSQGIFPIRGQYDDGEFWSGSDGNGNYFGTGSTNSCLGWTTSSSNYFARGATVANSKDFGSYNIRCDNQRRFICVCW